MSPSKIIGISGTNGSGKDSLGKILARHHGYMFVSGADFLRKEAKKRGLPIERKTLQTISTEWRHKHGLGVLVDKAVEILKQSNKQYSGLVVSSIRNTGEAQHLKDLGGVLVWIDADSQIRYKRITKRQRSTEDQKTYKQFINEEQAEMHQIGDAATLNLTGVKAKADIFLENNGNLDEFQAVAQKVLGLA